MATADCGCILTLYLILCRRCAPRSTNSTPATDEDVTLTKRTRLMRTQQHLLCAHQPCPVTLTTPCGDARDRLREKRASERFVLVLYGHEPCRMCTTATCTYYLACRAPKRPSRDPHTRDRPD